jgi:predicted phage terminase large subunit-like protein
MPDYTPAEHIAAQVLSRNSLYFFSRWMFINQRNYAWQRAGHHPAVCDALERVFNGQCKRLILNLPPRYSKTALVQSFIAWSLGHAPDSEFIYTSYSGRLAAASSYSVRGMVNEAGYKATFPAVVLRDDSQAKDEWRTTAGGMMYAVGAGGTITGYGAGKHREGFGGCILIDDPLKADEARSEVMRGNLIDWYKDTLQSRLNSPQTPIIYIGQRLHENDLAGWLLAGGSGEEWDHLCFPAIQEDGTALWPEKHRIEDLRRMEQSMPYTFAGQYMQRPAPLEGGLFKPDRIEIIDAIPALNIQWLRGWDLASTTDGDWTAGAKLGKLPDGRFIIADMVRMRTGPDERDAIMLNTAKRDTAAVKISIPQDPGQAGKTQIAYLTRQFQGFRITSSTETGDKVTRAEPMAAQVNVGNVMMLRGSWNDQLIEEMRMFPNGSFDDQIDAMSRAFGELIGPGFMRINPDVLKRLQAR